MSLCLLFLYFLQSTMEFSRFAIFALFFVGVVGSDARPLTSAEDYWHSIWPHTSMPKNLQVFLKPDDNGEFEDAPNPSSFFLKDDLYPGKTMKLKFRHRQFPGVAWLKATSGATNDAILNILDDKDVESMDSETTRLFIENICEKRPPADGETSKICAKSIESLVNFVISKLGKDVEPLSSSFAPHNTQYTILEGVQNVGEEAVMCHKLHFQKPVFICHQANATIAYTVPLEAADGTRTKAVAVCHHDTRGINPQILFHQLKIMPGTVPVCHFIGKKDLVWIPHNNKAAY